MNNLHLLNVLDDLLNPGQFIDYCPNGLQIQGSANISKVLFVVSVSQKVIEYAINNDYDAIVAHHGLFWNKSPYNLTGIQYKRVSSIIKNNINLYAYHLPLDNHPILGNNAQLANLFDFSVHGQTGEQGLLWYGSLKQEVSLRNLLDQYSKSTEHNAIYFGAEDQKINRVAWCTGGAQNMFMQAIQMGVDCYITGEVNEQVMALAEESGVSYIAGGHHVTERYGIKALSNHMSSYLPCDYIEFYNPI